MSDNPEFYSPSGDWFWKDPDADGMHIIADTIVRDCKRSIMTSYVMTAFMIFAFGFGIFTALTDFYNNKMFTVFVIAVSPLGVYMFVSALIAMKRYVVKAQEGRFRCRHVRIVDRRFYTNKGMNVFSVNIAATDEDDNAQAEVNVEKTLYDRMAIGLTGWFVMLDGEKKKLLVSPYWFISDTDSNASTAPLTKIEGSKGSVPSEEKLASVRKAWRSAHAVRTGMFVLAAILFIIAAVCMTAAILTGEGTHVIMGLFLGTAGVIILSMFIMADIFRGRKGLLILWAVWLNVNIFSLFLYIIKGTIGVRLAVLFVVFSLNLGMVWILNSTLIRHYREVSSGRCLVRPATVQSINSKRHIVFPFILLSTVSCIVTDNNGNAYEVDITGSQSRQLQKGTQGTLITLEKDTDRMFFFDDN